MISVCFYFMKISMHRKPDVELLPLDTKLERTLRNLKKVKGAETERPQRQMTVEDFWRLVIQDEYSAMRQPTIEANNFELKPALITMVQQHKFTGHPSEDLSHPTFIGCNRR